MPRCTLPTEPRQKYPPQPRGVLLRLSAQPFPACSIESVASVANTIAVAVDPVLSKDSNGASGGEPLPAAGCGLAIQLGFLTSLLIYFTHGEAAASGRRTRPREICPSRVLSEGTERRRSGAHAGRLLAQRAAIEVFDGTD